MGGDIDLCLIREDSRLMMIQNKGGYPRQNGRAPSAALVKHYQGCSIEHGQSFCGFLCMNVFTLGHKVGVYVCGTKSCQSMVQRGSYRICRLLAQTRLLSHCNQRLYVESQCCRHNDDMHGLNIVAAYALAPCSMKIGKYIMIIIHDTETVTFVCAAEPACT